MNKTKFPGCTTYPRASLNELSSNLTLKMGRLPSFVYSPLITTTYSLSLYSPALHFYGFIKLSLLYRRTKRIQSWRTTCLTDAHILSHAHVQC